jgi:glycosyltransferase involved in cell wall biosynthesis
MPRLYLIEQSALAIGGHYHAYSGAVARAARKAGLDVTILHNRRFTDDWGVDGATAIPAFDYTWSEADRQWRRRWERGNIAHDFRYASRVCPPRAGDHVLFSTLGYAELEQILSYFAHLPPGQELPFYHLLLRYDPDVLRAHLSIFRRLFDRISQSPMLRGRVLFHSDTHILAAEFSRLTGLPFHVLPIPFDQDHLRRRLGENRRPAKPLVIGYLGDARVEKNYADLPNAVAELWKEYVASGRARFVLQSNFNIPGGELGILQASQKLSQYPADKVDLITTALNGADYYDRVADADIIVIPYDPERYRGRSSGILIEAMAAGKPVVTTRGSWMATQVTPHHAVLYTGREQLGRALAQAIDEFDRLKTGADSIAPRMLDWSSGDNFVRNLVAATEPLRTEPEPASHILIVIDGDTLVHCNGAGLTALTQLRYLKDAGYAVSGLFLMNKRDWSAEQLESWANQLNERVAEFNLRAAFVAGTGRLSLDTLRQRSVRTSNESSLAADLEQVSTFDVSLDLVRYVREARFDAIWLNYVMNAPILEALGLNNIPVLCETHDVQSFQKAIYGGRRVDPEELQAEIAILRPFQHLVSVSAAETEFLLTYLPHAQITTTGIFPPLPGPAIDKLAGIKDVAELVFSCDPSRDDLNVETVTLARDREAKALADLKSVDILYVSSNHFSNVSGLRWFLDQVYLPLLAPAGISMLVAGSIRDAHDWPESPNLFFLGRLADLSPLYAAARTVVLPVLEGAGVAVKTFEALAHGRPLVATPSALRGIEGAVEGIEVATGAAEFAAAVIRLLGSRDARSAQGRAAEASATRLADPARYAELLNKAFGEVLGDRARVVRRSPRAIDTTRPWVEWDEDLAHCNRLVRGAIEDGGLNLSALRYLSAFPQGHARALLTPVCEALVENQSAHILSVRGHLRSALSSHLAEDVTQLVDTILAALALHADEHGSTKSDIETLVLFQSSLDLVIYGDDAAGLLSGNVGQADLRPTKLGGLCTGLLSASAARGLSIGHAKLRLGRNWSLAQHAGLDGSKVRLGRPVEFVHPDLGAQMIVAAGMTFPLLVAPLMGASGSHSYLDLVADPALVIDVRENGRTLPQEQMTRGGVVVVRLKLLARSIVAEPLRRLLTVSIVSGSGTIVRATHRLVVADDPVAILSEIDVIEAAVGGDTITAVSDDQPMGPTDVAALRQVLGVVRQGRPLPRSYAVSFRNRIARHGGLEQNLLVLMRAGAGESEPLPRADLLNVLSPSQFLLADRMSYVAASTLSVQIEADFENTEIASETLCFVDEAELVSPGAHGSRRSWMLPGEQGAGTRSWKHEVSFRHPDGQEFRPHEASVIWSFVAGRDVSTVDRYVHLTNTHSVEAGSGRRWAWTAGQTESVLILPLALRTAGTLRLGLISIGENHGDGDVRLFVNGEELAYERGHREGLVVLQAPLCPDWQDVATTEFVLRVARHFTPSGDPRTLGVAVAYVEFCQRL